ncbi:MAG: hypothetical protein QOI12_2319 [Alphaproteobacteria bacterium]|nr:hypothetical protein [Alphaproteobacteria bacterium]
MLSTRHRVTAALTVSVCLFSANAGAFDESKYPDFAGQWARTGGVQWDPTKPRGAAQQAPLTAEYQAIYEANLVDQAKGGQGTDPTFNCIPDGMPRAMNVVSPMEIVIQPKTTFLIIEYLSMLRRIFTDGRDFPKDFEPSFMGYSIGTWVDEDGDGRYDVLEIETRLLKGPRVYEPTGIPLHEDNQTVVKERIFLDKGDPNILHDEITTIDHALTRPWTVTKNYRREPEPVWVESVCAEGNNHLRIGKDMYMLSADGYLMPAKKDQPPPDLKYFNQSRK